MTWALLLLTIPDAAPPDPLALAVRRGLARLEEGATRYTQKRECFSCHHQALTVSAFAAARQRGLKVPDGLVREQVKFTLDSFRSKLDSVRKGQRVPGGNTMTAYALFTLAEADHGADDTTAALVDYLLVKQAKDGSWPAIMPRPPSEGSRFTNAALALAALGRYGEKGRVEVARKKGVEWLAKARPADHEDRVFRLMALVTAGEKADAARAELLAAQNADGSWSQLKDRPGDAYATGSALVALRKAGLATTAEAYRRGVAYLLRTQGPGGEWIVTTRSRPVQTFFDNGDPGGKSQFISFLATGWAVRALVEALP